MGEPLCIQGMGEPLCNQGMGELLCNRGNVGTAVQPGECGNRCATGGMWEPLCAPPYHCCPSSFQDRCDHSVPRGTRQPPSVLLFFDFAAGVEGKAVSKRHMPRVDWALFPAAAAEYLFGVVDKISPEVGKNLREKYKEPLDQTWKFLREETDEFLREIALIYQHISMVVQGME
ncbi:hypothetical protein GDO81_027360 [Engystomops pustulosus]|uniref:Apovitellenin-1 n=1 Tax=Engystomops pustulosus TaxID=76066 RepID=A0AAV6YXQ4_ENGPU|nr:hypothetical protein GDO81_027360 [Engystomops pustulosus]